MKEQVNTQNVFLLEMNGRIEEQKLEVQRRSDKTDGLSFKWLRPQCEPIQRPWEDIIKLDRDSKIIRLSSIIVDVYAVHGYDFI